MPRSPSRSYFSLDTVHQLIGQLPSFRKLQEQNDTFIHTASDWLSDHERVSDDVVGGFRSFGCEAQLKNLVYLRRAEADASWITISTSSIMDACHSSQQGAHIQHSIASTKHYNPATISITRLGYKNVISMVYTKSQPGFGWARDSDVKDLHHTPLTFS